MTPRAFSFNSPHGACPECQGLGAVYDFDPARVVPDDVAVARRTARSRRGRRAIASSCAKRSARSPQSFGIDLTVPFRRLPKKMRDVLLYGAQAGTRSAPRTRRSRHGQQEEGKARSVRRRLRRPDPQPAPALRGRHVDRAGGARAVSRAAAVPDVRRRAAQAAEPRRARQGPDDDGVRRPADQRGGEGLRRARADRSRER